MNYLSAFFYVTCMGAIKFSVLAFYLRLGDHTLRLASKIMFVIIGLQTIAYVVALATLCVPAQVFWNPRAIPRGTKVKCHNIGSFFLASAALNVVTDFVVYVLPIRVLLTLRIPFRQKVGVIVILSLGLVSVPQFVPASGRGKAHVFLRRACVASIIRLSQIPPTINTQDRTCKE